MQELINKLMSEAGLSQDQATKALSTVVTHVKSVLPPALAGNIDAMMGAKPGEAKAPESAGIMDKAGDMADAAKDKLSDFAGAAKEKFSELTNKDNLEKMKDQAEDKLEDLKDKAEDLAEGAMAKLKGLFGGDKA
jgi:uncharacterized protein YjbJ (UPF0337 family)